MSKISRRRFVGNTSAGVRRARIVLGGVAPIPWRLPKVEAMLIGGRITPELAARAGEAAVEGTRPLAKSTLLLLDVGQVANLRPIVNRPAGG